MMDLLRRFSLGVSVGRWIGLLSLIVLGLPVNAQSAPPNTSQTLTLAGLLTAANHGQFNGVATDASGYLYLLLNEHDGIRVLKTDATATTVLAEAHVGASGDAGLAMALDPAGNVYVAGTSTSGTLSGTAGAAFPAASGTSTNSFVAKFDASLGTVFLTFTGSTKTVAQSSRLPRMGARRTALSNASARTAARWYMRPISQARLAIRFRRASWLMPQTMRILRERRLPRGIRPLPRWCRAF